MSKTPENPDTTAKKKPRTFVADSVTVDGAALDLSALRRSLEADLETRSETLSETGLEGPQG